MAAPARKKAASPTVAKGTLFGFFGTDEARAKELAMKKVRELAPPDDEFGTEIIAGQADTVDHAVQIIGDTLQGLQTLPFFGGDKVVWLQGANFFADTVLGRSETTLASVERLLAVLRDGLAPGVKFVLSASEVDKRRTFFKHFSDIAEVSVHDRIDISKSTWTDQMEALVEGWSRQKGLSFSDRALSLFVLFVGVDTRQAQSELEKLDLYLGERRRASEDDVRAIVASTHAGIIFEIGDAVQKRNLRLALKLLDQQLRKGENAIALLLAAIIPKVRSLLQARDLVERHRLNAKGNYRNFESAVNRLPTRETAHLTRKKDGGINCYPLYLAAQECDAFTVEELTRALERCLRANLRLVTSALEPRLVLEQLMAEILIPSETKPLRR